MAKFITGFKSIKVEQFDRVMQGIFLNYFITDDDCEVRTRNGGFGSTGN